MQSLTLRKAVKNQIAEAQKIANGSGSEADIAEAKIELEVRGNPLHLLANANNDRSSRAYRQH
jgi:hypothetical protein